MLVIRKQQIQRFIATDEKELAAEVAKSIRQVNGERVAPYDEAQLQKMVKIGIARARANKLTGAEDIAAFVAVMFAVAPRFDEQKDIRQILDNKDISPEARFKLIFDLAPDQAWVEAERRYEDSFWFS
jgi:hypothetical protein